MAKIKLEPNSDRIYKEFPVDSGTDDPAKPTFVRQYSILADGMICPDQKGGTCGLYALAAIMRKARGCGFRATPLDDFSSQGITNVDPTLIEVALSSGYSKMGEMFNPEHIKVLYDQFLPQGSGVRLNCTVQNVTDQTRFSEIVEDTIKRHGVLMVPFSIDGEGNVICVNCVGKQEAVDAAHWGIIIGYDQVWISSRSEISAYHVVHWGRLWTYHSGCLANSNLMMPSGLQAKLAWDPKREDDQKLKAALEKKGTRDWSAESSPCELGAKLIAFKP